MERSSVQKLSFSKNSTLTFFPNLPDLVSHLAIRMCSTLSLVLYNRITTKQSMFDLVLRFCEDLAQAVQLLYSCEI